MSDKSAEIVELLAPVVSALGLELLGIEFVASGHSALLRLYIDAPARAVTLDDCEAVSREVSAALDVHDPISSAYTLEVSSPGIDRPLFTAEQFGRHVGEQAKVALRLPTDGRRRLQGVIRGVEDDRITLLVDEREWVVPHGNIEKARLVPDLVALGLAAAKPTPEPGAGRAARRPGKKSKKS